ncbi:MAG: response regulator [Desulfatitalea sp.]|nr:response regulator [Desulfatitalea sp.]
MKEKVILLVEDNCDDVDLTLRVFKKSRLANRVVVVRDGAEALDYIFCKGVYEGRDILEKPSLVLLDLKLPKVSGLEVLKKIRGDEQMRAMPVVIMTSSREQRDLNDGYTFGANSYIVKPVDFDKFTKAVEQLQLYWLVLNEAPTGS